MNYPKNNKRFQQYEKYTPVSPLIFQCQTLHLLEIS